MNEQEVITIFAENDLNSRQIKYDNFRCDSCKRVIHKAWLHWVLSEKFKTEIYLCNICEDKLKRLKLSVNLHNSKKTSNLDFNNKQLKEFKKIVLDLKLVKGVNYLVFKCNRCKKNIWKAYRFWVSLNKKTRLQLCIYCSFKLDIDKL